MEEVLVAWLAHVAGGRCYWGRAPDGRPQTPFVVLNVIGMRDDVTNDGPSGYVRSRVQCDCYGETYSTCKQTARALIRTLSGRRGNGVQGVFVVSGRDLPAENAGEAKVLFRTSIDVIVHHAE